MPSATPPDEVVLTLEVRRRSAPAVDVVALDLVDPSGAPLPRWEPGAHIDLDLAPDLVRQYSLCSAPHDDRSWRIAVLLEPKGRGGSAHAHSHLHEGTQVVVRGPRNHFRFEPRSRVVFIGGGIGITPLIPMLGEATACGLEWELHYGGRSRATMAYADELVSEHGDRVRLVPQDERGLLDLATILGDPRDDTSVYCCGPEPLLLAVEERCHSWPAGTLHVERFSPRELTDPVLEGSFEVELSSSGHTLVVPPDRSILSVVEEAGVEVYSSCTEGTCGTCETYVLEGVPDHRDSVLSDEDRATNEMMMICVSRARTPRLVLDL